jgi:hypothetical protein
MRSLIFILLLSSFECMGGAMILEQDAGSTRQLSIDSFNPDDIILNRKDSICSGFESKEKNEIIQNIYEEKNRYKYFRNNMLTIQGAQINGHTKTVTIDKYVKGYVDLLIKQEKLVNEVSQCAFSKQLKDSIQLNIGNSENTGFLNQLNNINSCFKKDGVASRGLKDTFSTVFNSIFKFFSNKKDLSKEDCAVLERTYEAWASFQSDENDLAKGDNVEDEIALYNVNPHNSSFTAWLKEREKGNIPAKGLPLLHVDTHTDLGHVHSHGDGWSAAMGIKELAGIVATSNDEQFENNIRSTLSASGADKAEIEKVISRGVPALKEEIFEQMRATIHDIAQPLVAGLATDVTSSLIMALPPWSPRIPRTEYDEKTGSKPAQIYLYEDEESEQIGIATSDASIYNHKDSPIVQGFADDVRVKEFDLVVIDANLESRVETMNANGVVTSSIIEEREATAADSFANHFPKDESQFILDIDLDAFVSEGRGNANAEPVSFGRHEKRYGTHKGHDANTETDPNIDVPLKEFELIEDRVNHFFKELEGLKAAGKLPAVITIADSTVLQAAMTRSVDDGQVGGNYTPSCLVFLLNYMVKEKLRNLYNVKEN